MKIKNNLHEKNLMQKVSDGDTIAQNLQNDADNDVKAAGAALLSQNQSLN